MAIQGTDNCQILVSPFPSPVPEVLPVQERPVERRVLLIDSRKPNSLSILEMVRKRLIAGDIPCEAIEKKKNPVGGEEAARTAQWARFRGLLVLGVFD